jgi:hypothetical protein
MCKGVKDFIDKLQDYDCIFYEKIFNKIIGNLLQGTEWIIKINSIKNYDINSEIIKIDKIKENTDLNILFKKLTKLNNKEIKKQGGNVYKDGII